MNKKTLSLLFLYFIYQSIAYGEIKEKLFVCTDRNLYICGELIHVYTKIENVDTLNAKCSKIIYCELINSAGIPILQTKFHIADNTLDHCLMIPEDIPTGYYCLKSYTKGMRNFSVTDFSFLPLKLINTRSQHVTKNDNLTNATGIADLKELQNAVDFTVSKNQFKKLENIELNKSNKFDLKNLCISVIPAASVLDFQILPQQNPTKEKFLLPYETDGATLSGSVVNETGIEIPNSKVNLSLIGARNNIMSTYSDSVGRYYFQAPDLNTFQELFISIDSTFENQYKLLVDNDFSPINPIMIFPQFNLTNEEKRTALNLARNLQIQKYFQVKSLSRNDSTKKNPPAYFYTPPTQIIYPSKYIQLTNLEECFNELPSQIKVVRTNKHINFYRTIDYVPVNPLIMIDMVILNDYNELLDINPQLVSRIEIVNKRYVKGEFIYDALISIISTNQDFAKVKLPSNGIFLNYTFPTKAKCDELDNSKIPDAKNTCTWFTNVDLKNIPLFNAPSVTGKYLIQIQGVDAQGIIRREIIPFEVR